MFEDDRGRLLQIEERLRHLDEGLAAANELADQIVWWHMSLIEQCCTRLTAAYLAKHPEIAALGLPSLDQVLNEPHPPVSLSRTLAREAIATFRPLLADLPPPASSRPVKPNPNSRFNEIVVKLQGMEQRLRAQGISALYLFGSVARREDELGSDVDLAFVVDADQGKAFSLLDQSRLTEELRDALKSGVDFVELEAFRSDVRERVSRDLIKVFGENCA